MVRSDNRAYISFGEVKATVTIPEALEVLGLADRFTRKGDTLTGICPLPEHIHGPRPNPNQFKINQKRGLWLWRCFGDCDRGGDVIELVKAVTGYDDAHVRFWFAEHFGDRLSQKKPKGQKAATREAKKDDGQTDSSASQCPSEAGASKPAEPSAPRQKLKPMSWSYDLHSCDYLLNDRKLKPETIARYGIGLCKARAGKRRPFLDGYIAIPIYTPDQPEESRQVGYLGRYAGELENWTEETPRYKFPKDFPRNSVVYGLREALRDSRDDQPLILVEGCFKVFWLYQEADLPNVVASFGASVGDEQVDILLGTGRPIALFFDGNAISAMRATAARLIRRTFVRAVVLAEDQEPDDLSGDELRSLLHFAY